MSSGRAAVGITLSALYIIIMGLILLHDWPRARTMPMNEWGDFLAGAFAPLAFFWLALGYFQQGDELRQNTEALRLQADQLKHQVEETKLLVQEAGAQAKASTRMVELQAAQALQDERRAMPRFTALNANRVAEAPGNPMGQIWLRLENSGAQISHLEIVEHDAAESLASASIQPQAILAPSGVCTINFFFSAGGKPLPDELTFALRYIDAVGMQRLSRFEIRGIKVKMLEHAVPA